VEEAIEFEQMLVEVMEQERLSFGMGEVYGLWSKGLS
jgi:hypothetical protein